MIRKLSAHYIYPVNGKPLKYGTVTCNEDGEIIALIDNKGVFKEEANLEFYNGIITPGFVNAHCHLELSHLKGKIPMKSSLVEFVKNIRTLRSLDDPLKSIILAEKEMVEAGIVVCGDISNSTISFSVKKISKIYFHSFIEIFGIQANISDLAWQNGLDILRELQKKYGLVGNITPHAPYSLSEVLWKKIAHASHARPVTWSVHNQENADEDLLFAQKKGIIADFLKYIDSEFASMLPKGKSSIEALLPFYKQASKLLLVHNTFTRQEDIPFLRTLSENLFLVLCPNSNLYIEGTLPPISLLSEKGFNFAIGTDSLASNNKLSVLEELKTLQHNFPGIILEDLICWGTLNGARALSCEQVYGSLEIGKRPGINLISGIDFTNMKLTADSQVQKLV